MTIKRMNEHNFLEFASKIDKAKNQFIPMLPYVKMPFHDFDRYQNYNDKGIYLIDEGDEGDCLYHLYHLHEGDDLLRATLILPTVWEKRFEIIEKSIPNLKAWFLKEEPSKTIKVQSLEYGEIEYFPTLSHYLIPTFIRNGFIPRYCMYMKWDPQTAIPEFVNLPDNLDFVDLNQANEQNIRDFYYGSNSDQAQFFMNADADEFPEFLRLEESKRLSCFIQDANGKIVAGALISEDSEKFWVDNLMVLPEYDSDVLGKQLMVHILKQFHESYPQNPLYIYLDRSCRGGVGSCEKAGFVAFEFWTDMMMNK